MRVCLCVCACCVCFYVGSQTPDSKLLVSKMSGQDGEITLVYLSHAGQPFTTVSLHNGPRVRTFSDFYAMLFCPFCPYKCSESESLYLIV